MTQRQATVGLLVLAIASSVPVTAFGSDDPDAGTPPSLAEWQKTMIQTPVGQNGCFEVEHPNTAWQEVPCAPAVDLGPIGVPPTVPAPSVVDSGTLIPGLSAVGAGTGAPGPLTVGGRTGFLVSVAYPDDTFSYVQGYFPQVVGVTSISSNAGDNNNMYSLQLNTNHFSTAACNGADDPGHCRGAQQFAYLNDGHVYMQYWLIGWGEKNLDGWTRFGADRYKDSDQKAYVGVQAISDLSKLQVVGTANSSENRDCVVFYYHRHTPLIDDLPWMTAVCQDSVLGLAQGWKAAEYNIFGKDSGRTATFNPGSSIVVAMDAGVVTPGNPNVADPYICIPGGYTGEENSLSLFGSCCFDTDHYRFFESNTDGADFPVCAPSANGSPCSADGDCLSNYCWKNTCSPAPVSCSPPRPTIQASDLRMTWPTVSDGPLSVSWARGNGEATAVFMQAESTMWLPAPVDGTVYYQDASNSAAQGYPLSTFRWGTQIGTSGWYCVYNGPGSNFETQESNLQAGIRYQVMALTYNGSFPCTTTYLTTTASGNPGYFTTPVGTPATPLIAQVALGLLLLCAGLRRITRKRGQDAR